MSAAGMLARRRLKGGFSRTLAILFATLLAAGGISATGTFTQVMSATLAKTVAAPVMKSDLVATASAGSDEVISLAEAEPGVTEAVPMAEANVTVGATNDYAKIVSVPFGSKMQWLDLAEGHAPSGQAELAADSGTLARLNLQLGDEVTFEVSSLNGESESASHTATIVGLVNAPDANSLSYPSFFADPATTEELGFASGAMMLVAAGADAGAVAASLQAKLQAVDEGASVVTTDAFVEHALESLSGATAGLAIAVLAFMLIALVAAVMVIRNTMQVILAQRMREFGLLRLVGATGGQVGRTVLIEALIVAGIGGIVGAVAGYGLTVLVTKMMQMVPVAPPVGWMVAGLLVALSTTLIAGISPALAASRLRPAQALRLAATVERHKRGAVIAAWSIGGVVTLFGIGVMTLGVVGKHLMFTVAGGFFLAIGLILLVPQLVRLLMPALAALVRSAQPPLRLAGENLRRSSRRAGAVVLATALGGSLVVAMLVAVSSLVTSLTHSLDERYAVDAVITLSGDAPLPQDLIARLSTAEGVSQAAAVRTVEVTTNDRVLSLGEVAEVPEAWAPTLQPAPGADLAHSLFLGEGWTGRTDAVIVTAPGGAAPLTLTPVVSDLVSQVQPQEQFQHNALVSAEAFESLGGAPTVTQLWLNIEDSTSHGLVSAVDELRASYPTLQIGGGLSERMIYEQLGDTLTKILLGMLSLTVLISAVGLASVVSLSVAERRREIALLRAMGMTRSGVRGMVFAESIALALVGAAFSIVIGVPLGLAAIASVPFGATFTFVPTVPWLGLAAVTAVAALLGVISGAIPAQRAAKVAPAMALAQE